MTITNKKLILRTIKSKVKASNKPKLSYTETYTSYVTIYSYNTCIYYIYTIMHYYHIAVIHVYTHTRPHENDFKKPGTWRAPGLKTLPHYKKVGRHAL